jgi:hypothetical protein
MWEAWLRFSGSVRREPAVTDLRIDPEYPGFGDVVTVTVTVTNRGDVKGSRSIWCRAAKLTGVEMGPYIKLLADHEVEAGERREFPIQWKPEQARFLVVAEPTITGRTIAKSLVVGTTGDDRDAGTAEAGYASHGHLSGGRRADRLWRNMYAHVRRREQR